MKNGFACLKRLSARWRVNVMVHGKLSIADSEKWIDDGGIFFARMLLLFRRTVVPVQKGG